MFQYSGQSYGSHLSNDICIKHVCSLRNQTKTTADYSVGRSLRFGRKNNHPKSSCSTTPQSWINSLNQGLLEHFRPKSCFTNCIFSCGATLYTVVSVCLSVPNFRYEHKIRIPLTTSVPIPWLVTPHP